MFYRTADVEGAVQAVNLAYNSAPWASWVHLVRQALDTTVSCQTISCCWCAILPGAHSARVSQRQALFRGSALY